LHVFKEDFKCSNPIHNLGEFATPPDSPVNLPETFSEVIPNYALLCNQKAMEYNKEAGYQKCNVFMYSYMWPSEGCQCCSSQTAVESDTKHMGWDIYQTKCPEYTKTQFN
jgi:hypothetical protein